MSNLRLIRDLYAAFARGDVAAVMAGFDPRIEWREAEGSPFQPGGKAWVGPDSVLENLFEKLDAEWKRFAVHTQTFHEAGDTVVVEARYSGSYNSTGRAVDAQACHVWKFQGGKIKSFQEYTDTAQLQHVMGSRMPAAATKR